MTKLGRPRVQRVKVECACCGAEIEKYLTDVQRNKTGRFFCSAACRNKIGVKPRTVPRRSCEQCGKEFVSYGKATGRFCSTACYDEWQGRNRTAHVCETCGSEFWLKPSQERHQAGRFCSTACKAAGQRKRPLERMHNGKPALVDNAGYVRVYEPDHPCAFSHGWVFEHRLIAEQTLGRELEPNEHVHHANGDKADNRPENLVVMSHGEHSSITGLANGERLREWAEYRKRYGPL